MSTSVTPQKTQNVFAPPLAKPLDESVWQAWVLKGRAQDERSHATCIKAVTSISLVTLLLAAAAGFPVGPVLAVSDGSTTPATVGVVTGQLFAVLLGTPSFYVATPQPITCTAVVKFQLYRYH
jgi:hypothetical protein